MEVQREIQNLTKTQKIIQRRINTLNEKIQQAPKLERNETMLQTEDLPLSMITETEKWILHMLVEEGSTTAPKVEKKIGKTREHTARLMKKLWQEGYIERDTHRMPFTYRPTKKLKKILKKKTLEKKVEKVAPEITKEEKR
jgi:predicted transcriptional regulator